MFFMKTCTVCKQELPLADFYKRSASYDGKDSCCKTCKRVQIGAYRSKNIDTIREKYRIAYRTKPGRKRQMRNAQLKRDYGITIEEFESMYLDQSGRCKICKSETTLVVDHHHGTGTVRGLLCHSCNRCIGLFKEDITILQAAINYLED